jgi:hypothetical protein
VYFLLAAGGQNGYDFRYEFTPHQDDGAAAPVDSGGPVRIFVDGCEQMKIQL